MINFCNGQQDMVKSGRLQLRANKQRLSFQEQLHNVINCFEDFFSCFLIQLPFKYNLLSGRTNLPFKYFQSLAFAYFPTCPSNVPFLQLGGSMAKWFRMPDLKPTYPWFKFFSILLSGFVLTSIEFKFSTTLSEQPNGQPHINWDS